MTVIIMAKIGRKMPVVGLVMASKITPAQTAKIAIMTNMYFIGYIITQGVVIAKLSNSYVRVTLSGRSSSEWRPDPRQPKNITTN